MASRLTLRVGGISLALRSRDAGLELGVGGARPRFLVRDGGPADLTLEVARVDLAGADAGMETAFDTGFVWKLGEAAGRPTLVVRLGGSDGIPSRLVRLDPSWSAGELLFHAPFTPPDGPLSVLEHPVDELLFVLLLMRGRGAEVHACGVVDDDGTGLLLTGHSGAGKSTLSRLWAARPGVTLLSDDRIVLRKDGDAIRLHGTPWHGDAGFAEPASAPLSRLVILEHGSRNELLPLTPGQAVAELFTRCFLPFHDPAGIAFTLAFLESVVERVPCSLLRFVPDASAVDFLRAVEVCR